MSNSDSQQWHSLAKMYLNIDLKPAEQVAWFTELRLSVSGWRHDSSMEGNDPTKGERAREINDELGKVVRYVKDLPTLPRKHEGGKNDYKGKLNVADVQLWVWIYRQNTNKTSGYNCDLQFVEAGKRLIQRCLDKDQTLFAAIVSTGDPMGADMADFNIIFDGLPSRGFTKEEIEKLQEFCRGIDFCPYSVFTNASAYQEYLSVNGRVDSVGNAVNYVSKEWEEGVDFL